MRGCWSAAGRLACGAADGREHLRRRSGQTGAAKATADGVAHTILATAPCSTRGVWPGAGGEQPRTCSPAPSVACSARLGRTGLSTSRVPSSCSSPSRAPAPSVLCASCSSCRSSAAAWPGRICCGTRAGCRSLECGVVVGTASPLHMRDSGAGVVATAVMVFAAATAPRPAPTHGGVPGQSAASPAAAAAAALLQEAVSPVISSPSLP